MLTAQAPAPDPVLQAMHDEIDRARKLQLQNLEPPYFIQFVLDEAEQFSVSATLGGILAKHRERFRSPEVRVRVGDYSFDNTNFVGAGFGGSRYDLGRFPLENSYPVLRRYFWLEADSAYKGGGGGDFAQASRSAQHDAIRKAQRFCACRAGPLRDRDFPTLTIDEDAWTNRVRALSAIFAKYPDIQNSVGGTGCQRGRQLRCEFRRLRSPVAGKRRDPPGARLGAGAGRYDGAGRRDLSCLGTVAHAHRSRNESRRRCAGEERGVRLRTLPRARITADPCCSKAPRAPQVFAEVLGDNLSLTRRPVVEGGRGGGGQASELEGRIGARVLPDYFRRGGRSDAEGMAWPSVVRRVRGGPRGVSWPSRCAWWKRAY